jgi:hypothetical protein
VVRHLSAALTIGAVLPAGKTVSSVTLNGAPVAYHVVTTARGQEVRGTAVPDRLTWWYMWLDPPVSPPARRRPPSLSEPRIG